MILVCPDWQRDLWWKDLQDMVLDKMLFPRGQKIFRAPGRSLGGTKWGVWAYLLDGEKSPEEVLVFGIKEGGQDFIFPSPTLTAVEEKHLQKMKVWGTPFCEKDLLEEDDE